MTGFWLVNSATPETTQPAPSSPPKHEQATFKIAPGLRLELVACEPQIQSPVAMTFDEDGKLWVVEMRDYPNGPAPGTPPEGRIVILQDKNSDGFYEHSSVFADKLLFANGLLRWKDGVIVTQAPNIVFLRDTDGDGKCDKQEILYEGFAAENPQLRVSHPVLGVDNMVYVANGLRGGKVIRKGDPAEKAISLSGMDFRFDPLGDRHEAISGPGQYGNTFDDWGNRFVCDNRHQLRHVVLPNHYVKRNPFLAVPALVEDVSELEDGPLNSGGKIYPLSKNWTTSILHAGRFTAACGVYIYRSGLLPKQYQGAAFTCDPTGNLVHCETLSPKGATFVGKPMFDKKEFLATPHDWCRPVFLTDGPDGALYVVDMYRAVIEHPDFMPAALKNRPDLLLGKDKGRIWRIVPEGHKHNPEPALPGKANTAKLLEYLSHAHAWQRITAQRLLLQSQDRSAHEGLRQLCTKGSDPRGRLHALWLLHGMKALDEKTLLNRMSDPHPSIREHAVLLAEKFIANSAAFREQVISLAHDPDARVRFQVALSLGEWDNDKMLGPLAVIALRSAGDRWTRQAVASAVPKRAGALVTLIWSFQWPNNEVEVRASLLRELSALAGARGDPDEVSLILKTVLSPVKKEFFHDYVELVILQGLAEGMGQRGKQLGTFLKSLPASKQGIADLTSKRLSAATKFAQNSKKDLSHRLLALALLAHVPWDTAKPALTTLLNDDPGKEVRLAAVRALAAHSQPEVAAILLKSWKSYTPPLRVAVTEALLRQSTWTSALLDEIDAGRIKPGDIDVTSSKRLLNHKQPQISARAKKLLQSSLPAARQKVLAEYQAALKLKGDTTRGLKVFEKNCATCHRVGNLGVNVAPDISDSERTKTPEAFLSDILNPNQAIDNNYVNYLVVTKGGKFLNGIIAAETASSITLRRANNESEVVLRQDIEEITSTGLSLMPDGLEQNITVAEMADLLSYLKNWRYLDGSVPAVPGAP